MRENTSYVEQYSENHLVVLLFFSAISKWDPENLAIFLLFLTGSSQVPLCLVHTCFNTFDLPEYEYELNEKLLQSIQECEIGIS